VRVVVVASDGGRPSQWQATVVRESTVASDGGRKLTAATIALVTASDTTAMTATTVARFKRFEIQTHCFSTLDGICWAAF